MHNILVGICLLFGINTYSQVPDTCFTAQEIQDISQTLDSLYYIDSINNAIIKTQTVLIAQLEQVILISDLQLQYKSTQISLLQDNINLYIEREKLSKPKWYSHPAVWFGVGVVTTIGIAAAIIGVAN
jgi:hypothetical protein